MNPRIALPILVLLIFLAVGALSGLSAERVALVIGNNDYPTDSNFPDLTNCVNDAKLISETLREVGFEVIEVFDADVSMMDDALAKLEAKIDKGGTAAVYFAGHGIEFEGENYLMGSNAKFQARSRLTREGMEAEIFASAMVLAGAKTSFLFLDCCRELPQSAEWAGRGQKKFGLAEISIEGDIMISMAAAPGKQALEPTTAGKNSPYALALAKWIPSGEDHLKLFQHVRKEVHEMTEGQQRTWENGSFLEEFRFVEGVANAKDQRISEMEAEIERLKKIGAAKMTVPPVPTSPPEPATPQSAGIKTPSSPLPQKPATLKAFRGDFENTNWVFRIGGETGGEFYFLEDGELHYKTDSGYLQGGNWTSQGQSIHLKINSGYATLEGRLDQNRLSGQFKNEEGKSMTWEAWLK